jgi:hypothetical protein
MSAPFRRRSAAARCGGERGLLRLALCCARNVHGATDRRMPEAYALAGWLSQSASTFSFDEEEAPGDLAIERGARHGVPAQEWRKIGAALEVAEMRLPDRQDAPVDLWLRALAGTLALDAWTGSFPLTYLIAASSGGRTSAFRPTRRSPSGCSKRSRSTWCCGSNRKRRTMPRSGDFIRHRPSSASRMVR